MNKCYSVFTARQLYEDLLPDSTPTCDSACPHVTVGFYGSISMDDAQIRHSELVNIVNKYPDAKLVIDQEVDVIGYSKSHVHVAHLEPTELHNEVETFFNTTTTDTRPWKCHVSIHEAFQDSWVGVPMNFLVQTFWGRHVSTYHYKKPRMPKPIMG